VLRSVYRGNLVTSGGWAQLELSFGYLLGIGNGCYTRELWR
jgi:hypothetical protein